MTSSGTGERGGGCFPDRVQVRGKEVLSWPGEGRGMSGQQQGTGVWGPGGPRAPSHPSSPSASHPTLVVNPARRKNDLVRLDIWINGEVATPLSTVCHRDNAFKVCGRVCGGCVDVCVEVVWTCVWRLLFEHACGGCVNGPVEAAV